MKFQFSMYYLSFSPLWISVLFMDAKSLWIDKTAYPWTERISITLILVLLVISVFFIRNDLNGNNPKNKKLVVLLEAKE